MEDGVVLPAEQPAVVVCPPRSLHVLSQHRSDLRSRQRGPVPVCRVVDLAILLDVGSASPRATDDEDAAVGERGLRLISALQIHGCCWLPGVCRSVEKAGLGGVIASSHHHVAGTVDSNSRAEHVVMSLRDNALRHSVGAEVPARHGRLATGSGVEFIGVPGRPKHDLASRFLGSSSCDDRKVDGGTPSASVGNLLDGVEVCVDVQLRNPDSARSVFRVIVRSDESHVSSRGRFKGRHPLAVGVWPHTVGNGPFPVLGVLAQVDFVVHDQAILVVEIDWRQ